MKPILFSGEMVKAILDGRKTVTRRIIKLKYGNTHIKWLTNECGTCLVEMQNDIEGETFGKNPNGTTWQKLLACREIAPQYKKGNILYVRETFCAYDADHVIDGVKYAYKADATAYSEEIRRQYGYKWHPSIHMPREAARIFLRVTNVRVERLQDINEEQSRAEGCVDIHAKTGDGKFDDVIEFDLTAREVFAELWDSLNAKRGYGWDENPWVWVIEFEQISKEEAYTNGK